MENRLYPEDLKYSQTHQWVKVDKDIAKRLLDFGFNPPTIYFPLIVKEALMIEPTEN
jgi:glycine cleavage system protein P-like pyridoxal-binding family